VVFRVAKSSRVEKPIHPTKIDFFGGRILPKNCRQNKQKYFFKKNLPPPLTSPPHPAIKD
jgi:hypothetical protein